MEIFIPLNPTVTSDPPELPKVPAYILPENHPTNNKTPTSRQSQRIRNKSSNPPYSKYALATRVIIAIDILVHYNGDEVTNPITYTAEEYLALLHDQNSKIWTKAFKNNLGMLAQGVGTRMPTGNNTILLLKKKVYQNTKR